MNRKLAARIETSCAHCGRKLDLEVENDLNWSVRQRDASPLLFEPKIDWSRFRAANIIHDY